MAIWLLRVANVSANIEGALLSVGSRSLLYFHAIFRVTNIVKLTINIALHQTTAER